MSSDESLRKPEWLAVTAFSSPSDSPPPAPEVKVKFGASSRPRPSRVANDDHYLILRLGRSEETLLTSLGRADVPTRVDEYGYVMVIADGIGADGEAASRMAISTLVHLSLYFGKWNVRIDEPIAHEVMDRAERFYRSINATLLNANHEKTGGMQTTLTAVLTAGAELIFVHVGHARAYLYRDGELMQLTRDHTLDGTDFANASVAKRATARDGEHVLSGTLGAPGDIRSGVDIERIGLLDRDIVLLCTNGLTDVVDNQQIGAVLGNLRTPDEQCDELVNLAAALGSRDDVTALVGHYRIF